MMRFLHKYVVHVTALCTAETRLVFRSPLVQLLVIVYIVRCSTFHVSTFTNFQFDVMWCASLYDLLSYAGISPTIKHIVNVKHTVRTFYVYVLVSLVLLLFLSFPLCMTLLNMCGMAYICIKNIFIKERMLQVARHDWTYLFFFFCRFSFKLFHCNYDYIYVYKHYIQIIYCKDVGTRVQCRILAFAERKRFK